MNIVAIGGGEIAEKETLPLDRFIVDLSGKRAPRALFIPTASGDADGYCSTFDEIYGTVLGCKTDHLLLHSRDKTSAVLQDKILSADVIYVGGGNTLRMMKLWRRLGVDSLLAQAGRIGSVLAGLSAGAICWHQWGHSDSTSFSGNAEWSFIRVRGLGFVSGLFCPHLDAEKRHDPFSHMIMKRGGVGIACDNNAAIWYSDEKALVKTSCQKAGVCRYQKRGSVLVADRFGDGDALPLRSGHANGLLFNKQGNS